MPATRKSYLAFVPQHTPGMHEVLAVINHGDGPEVETLAGFSDAPSATVLASALNGFLLHQVTAERRLHAVLENAPAPVREVISDLLPILAASTDDPATPRVARHLPMADGGGLLLFPTTNCPGRCEFCGTCRDDCTDCPECADSGCEICLPATLTPRTAAVLAHALAILADEAYDYVYRTGSCRDGMSRSAGRRAPLRRRTRRMVPAPLRSRFRRPQLGPPNRAPPHAHVHRRGDRPRPGDSGRRAALPRRG
jgi:hypothetical protein